MINDQYWFFNMQPHLVTIINLEYEIKWEYSIDQGNIKRIKKEGAERNFRC